MTRRATALRRTFARDSMRRSLLVALVIGTILNGINQGAELLAGEPLVLWKLALTYFVPFAVASYGAFSLIAAADCALPRRDDVEFCVGRSNSSRIHSLLAPGAARRGMGRRLAGGFQ